MDGVEVLSVVTGGGVDAVVPGEGLAGGVGYECILPSKSTAAARTSSKEETGLPFNPIGLVCANGGV